MPDSNKGVLDFCRPDDSRPLPFGGASSELEYILGRKVNVLDEDVLYRYIIEQVRE
jgi:hypothetical protein